MQSMLSDGIAGRGLQREQKPIVLPNYGRDISIGEAIDSASNVKYTATTTLGIEFKIANDTDQSNTEHSKEISLRLAAFLLYYPNMLHGSLSMSDIVLNLDCGSGICGIAALQLGYTNVIFADPHEGVVRHAVWPNIWMNCEDKLVHSRCISSANWVALSEYLSDPGPNK